MTAWTLLVCGASLAFLAWLWWKERRRTLQKAASVLAVASLAAWGIPLHWPFSVKAPPKGTAILLTPGYDRDSLRVFQAAYGKALPVFDYTRGTKDSRRPGPGVQNLLSLSRSDAGVLHVFGYGLSKAELSVLPPARIVFHPSPLPDGITAVQWDAETGQGLPFSLRAHVSLSAHRDLQGKKTARYGLRLSGLGTTLDSVALYGGSDTDIVLRTVPRGTGRVVYSVSLTEGRDTLENDPAPTQVRNPTNWSILLLASSPDFENKFLRQWLAASGHSVSMRTAISKGKYDAGFSGRAPADLTVLPGSFLDSVDILIADPAALGALPETVLSRIREQVRQGGMGLILRADSSLAVSWAPALSAEVVRDTLAAPVSLVLQDGANTTPLAVQQLRPSAYVSYREGTQPLLKDTRSHIWATSVLYGSGQVVLTTLQTAYRWMLSGDTSDYAAYWSLLMQQAARRSKTGPEWTVNPALPRLRQPAQVSFLSEDGPQADGFLRQGQIAGMGVALEPDPSLPFLWQGAYWPLRAGWQAGTDHQGLPWWWYAYAAGDWGDVDNRQKQEATRSYAALSLARPAIITVPNPASPENIPSYYFFVAFMCFAGFLWAAKMTRASD
jgi:hypothetical protein